MAEVVAAARAAAADAGGARASCCGPRAVDGGEFTRRRARATAFRVTRRQARALGAADRLLQRRGRRLPRRPARPARRRGRRWSSTARSPATRSSSARATPRSSSTGSRRIEAGAELLHGRRGTRPAPRGRRAGAADGARPGRERGDRGRPRRGQGRLVVADHRGGRPRRRRASTPSSTRWPRAAPRAAARSCWSPPARSPPGWRRSA